MPYIHTINFNTSYYSIHFNLITYNLSNILYDKVLNPFLNVNFKKKFKIEYTSNSLDKVCILFIVIAGIFYYKKLLANIEIVYFL
jgi:hypothetical protein